MDRRSSQRRKTRVYSVRTQRLYQGRLVHRRRSRDGVIEVVEDQLFRSLHFGDSTRQSAMSLHHTAVLVLEYTQTMMACLLFNPQPHRILLLGLGGGSLAKFLLQHFPGGSIDAVEPARDVVEVARSHFDLPANPSLKVHINDAVSFMGDASGEPHSYDLIFVDVYDAHGMVPGVVQTDFLAAAQTRLSEAGVLVLNLSRPQRDLYRQALRNLRRCFPGRLYRLPVIDKGNEIAFAVKTRVQARSAKAIRSRAHTLSEQLGLDFRDYLAHMRRHNPSLLGSLLK